MQIGATVSAVAQYSGWLDNYTSYMTGLFLTGEIEVTLVNDMVNKVKGELGPQGTLDRLEIYAHGTDTYVKIGDNDTFHDWTPKVMMPKMARLTPNFSYDGEVVLYVCQAGYCLNVASELAKTLGVNVYAIRGDVYPNLHVTTGDNLVAYPDGRISYGISVEDRFWP